ncbi:DPP IV N-terminal domain-containing protein [Parvularcula sp. LCG005]|uniref:DPP IV N-terminal domain-containing protein n=1 Tax=Parvularcula sp. LCG005 TaxID=3078805 RepID=UPI002943D713|nr:DPP IV N-terminal domain-containing protein [Parvularcula sp. LCG005]WOI54195.1 DPP IV N-terminal domain-containing protein [Parvularcula sp. LCG005]
MSQRPLAARLATLLIGTSLSLSGAALADDLTIEALNSDQGLSGPSLRGASFSPDGSMITVLRGRDGDARTLDLWAYDVKTGDAKVLVRSDDLVSSDVELSEEEKNRRERQRIYDSGIISYDWDTKGETLLFPLGGDVYTYDLATGEPTQVTSTETFETDPKMSPSGGYVSYVRDDELVVYDRAKGKEKTVTSGAGGTIRNAVSEFVAQEELNRDTGYWWAPDDSQIVFLQIDESPVQIAERLDFGVDGAKTIRQRYPFAGTDNVNIKLGLVKPGGGKPTWIDLGPEEDIYLADVHWSSDSKTVYVERLSRDQKTLDMLKVDPKTGKSELLFSETDDNWINLNGGFYALKDGGFLRLSERTGFTHIDRHGADGKLAKALTSGEWNANSIACVDQTDGEIIFSGWMDTPLENHLYTVSLDGGEVTPLTTEAGWHSGSFGKDCESFIHRFSSQDQPTQASVMTKDGERSFWLLENKLDNDHPYAPYLDSHLDWTFGQLEAPDGQMMDYALLVPPGLKKGAKAPAIQLVYGGPHAQRVANRWGDLSAQMLADKGYVVFKLDNRGAANRGKAFENVLYRQMGQPEVVDQAIGTEWLASQPYVDADRIGVQGWSYGGYMTLMMLAQKPELYAAGVSGAPVTDWRTYDTAYTERYMGDPREVGDKYDASSVLTYADGIEDGELLLIHGMADDNVIFQNSIDMIAALQQAGTEFELMTYPGEKHGFRNKQNKMHRDYLGLDFFERKLKGE